MLFVPSEYFFKIASSIRNSDLVGQKKGFHMPKPCSTFQTIIKSMICFLYVHFLLSVDELSSLDIYAPDRIIPML